MRQTAVSSPAGILKLIRDKVANDWRGLEKHWAVPGTAMPGGFQGAGLYQVLRQLRSVGLIAYKGDFRRGGRINVTDRFLQIQSILRIRLSSVIRIQEENAMPVTPYFGPPGKIEGMPDVFVLMPFEPRLKKIYTNHIRKLISDE